jgi:2-iminobutanoate/2-iminopropanoate deaminase
MTASFRLLCAALAAATLAAALPARAQQATIEREKILPVAQSAYSAAVKTKGGTLVFLGGIGPTDDKGALAATDFVGQVEQAFRNLDRAMAAAGGTREDIVTMTVYTTERRWNDIFTGMRRDFFKEGYPSSAFVEARKLKTPGSFVEIRAIAVLGQ